MGVSDVTGDCRGDRSTLSALAKLDPKGQKRVSEFNLITWEGPAEPVRPFIQFSVFETKETEQWEGLHVLWKTS